MLKHFSLMLLSFCVLFAAAAVGAPTVMAQETPAETPVETPTATPVPPEPTNTPTEPPVVEPTATEIPAETPTETPVATPTPTVTPVPVEEVPGDFSGDGVFDDEDVILILDFFLSEEEPTAEQLEAADADGNGVITPQDIQTLWLQQNSGG